ncbi:hypothetical protein [Dyella acidisoli]|nr:hypothetical protein [Dyella acidisoli]
MSVPVDSGAPQDLRGQGVVISAAVVMLMLATADLLFACTYWYSKFGVPPARIAQNIASGLLGKHAFVGGGSTAALGVLLHYAMMAAMVGVYYVAAGRLVVLTQRPWLYGALYGALLFIVMNLIVVPLSAVPKAPVVMSWIISSIVVHVIIGLAIALSARRAL